MPTAPGDRLIRVGAVLCVAGMVLTMLSLLPMLFDVRMPSVFWALSMLAGVGFGLVLLGLVAKSRRRSRVEVSVRVPVD